MKLCTLQSAASILPSAVPNVFSMKVSRVADARWVDFAFSCAWQRLPDALILKIFIHWHLTCKPSIYVHQVVRTFLCGCHQVHRGATARSLTLLPPSVLDYTPQWTIVGIMRRPRTLRRLWYLVLLGPPTILLEPEEVRTYDSSEPDKISEGIPFDAKDVTEEPIDCTMCHSKKCYADEAELDVIEE